MKDFGLTLVIVVFSLIILGMVFGIGYRIYEEATYCYNVTVVFNDCETKEYHCTSYSSDDDSYLLHFHDGSKLDILKLNVECISFKEVKDNEN